MKKDELKSRIKEILDDELGIDGKDEATERLAELFLQRWEGVIEMSKQVDYVSSWDNVDRVSFCPFCEESKQPNYPIQHQSDCAKLIARRILGFGIAEYATAHLGCLGI